MSTITQYLTVIAQLPHDDDRGWEGNLEGVGGSVGGSRRWSDFNTTGATVLDSQTEIHLMRYTFIRLYTVQCTVYSEHGVQCTSAVRDRLEQLRNGLMTPSRGIHVRVQLIRVIH